MKCISRLLPIIIALFIYGCGGSGSSGTSKSTTDSSKASPALMPRMATTGISYGVKTEMTSLCAGAGLCGAVAVGQPYGPPYVKTTLTIDDAKPNILVLSFSMDDMKLADTSQFSFLMKLLTTQNGSNGVPYVFPVDFNLSDSIFQGLGLSKQAKVIGKLVDTLKYNPTSKMASLQLTIQP